MIDEILNFFVLLMKEKYVKTNHSFKKNIQVSTKNILPIIYIIKNEIKSKIGQHFAKVKTLIHNQIKERLAIKILDKSKVIYDGIRIFKLLNHDNII